MMGILCGMDTIFINDGLSTITKPQTLCKFVDSNKCNLFSDVLHITHGISREESALWPENAALFHSLEDDMDWATGTVLEPGECSIIITAHLAFLSLRSIKTENVWTIL